MWEFEIQLRSVQDVQEFVALATTLPFTILVEDRHHRVNGKSFMEMFCLDLTHPLTTAAQCSEAEFQQFRDAAARFLTK